MKAIWNHLAGKIDSRGLRDRVIVSILIGVIAVALGYFWFLAGTLKQQGDVRRGLSAKENEIAQVQTQLQSVQQGRKDPDAASRERITQLKRLLLEAESGLQEKRDRIVPPEKVLVLLEEVLSRHRKLTLIDLRTVAATPLFDGRDGQDSPRSAEPKAGDPKSRDSKAATARAIESKAGDLNAADVGARDHVRGIYRHAIEVRLRGTYLDLVEYLNELERLSIQVYWSDIAVEMKDYPTAEMKVTLFTVSFERVWMTV